jgi:ubiquinone/menaquinone biosynthesis C-methylase UbiE
LINENEGPERNMERETKKEHWDKIWHKVNLPFNEKLVKVILSNFDIINLKILEVGAGSGATSLYLASLGADVTVIDYSDEAINRIRKNNKTDLKINVVQGDAFCLPFKSDSFDLIFSQGLIEHFRKPEGIITEKRRVAIDEGYVITDVPQTYNLYTLKKNILIFFNKWFAGWESSYSIRQLENLVVSCGLTVRKRYAYAHMRNLDRIQERLFHKKIIPDAVCRIYNALWENLEKSKLALYTLFCIIVMAQKQKTVE